MRYLYKIKQKHKKHTTTYTKIQNRTKRMQKKCDEQNSHIGGKPHMIYISSNNDRYPVTKTFNSLLPI